MTDHEAAQREAREQMEAIVQWCDEQRQSLIDKGARYRATFDADMPPDKAIAMYARIAGYASALSTERAVLDLAFRIDWYRVLDGIRDYTDAHDVEYFARTVAAARTSPAAPPAPAEDGARDAELSRLRELDAAVGNLVDLAPLTIDRGYDDLNGERVWIRSGGAVVATDDNIRSVIIEASAGSSPAPAEGGARDTERLDLLDVCGRTDLPAQQGAPAARSWGIFGEPTDSIRDALDRWHNGYAARASAGSSPAREG